MKTNFTLHIVIYFLFLFYTQSMYSQQLVQSFIESNINGKSAFGWSESNAGDVNNDGYDDVIVGAAEYSSITGRAYIYYGGSIMDNTADVIMTGEGINNYFGYSVSGAGDVNDDGYDDVIIGAYGSTSNPGRAYIYYGGSSMNNTVDVTMTGEGTDNYFGYSVAGAGDVNNDGYDDVIVGAYAYNSYTGQSYIYYGGSSMNNTADLIMNGESANNSFGISVSKAGDVNNDGYVDVIVGANGYNSGTGRAYIYYGGSSMNNTADVIMTGEGTNNSFGRSVSNAGDVNNDGYDDVVVGADGYITSTGRAYIYYGGSSMNNTVDVIMTGELTYDYFGNSVSSAGDVNNDGYDDVIVGAYGYEANTGRSYIYYGSSSMNNIADVIMTGNLSTIDYFGRSVSSAGDVNNDGYDDVIVGAPFSISETGRAYIFYGGSSMNNSADVTMMGESINKRFGSTVSGAGDVNNDGYDDVIVYASDYPSYTGRVYIYYGGDSMDNTADIIMTGEGSNNNFGRSVSCAGDVNDDGYDDVIVGAYMYPANGKVYIYTTNIALQAALTALIEGFYNGTSIVPDTVTVELRNSGTPYGLVEQKKIVLNSSGQGTGLFSNVLNAVPYYIVIKHRNSIETWSRLPQQFTSGILTYDFTNDSAKAYGNNLKLKGSKWCIYSGDVNQDGIVDITDLVLVDNDYYNSVTGYTATNVNGDGIVDIADLVLVDYNSLNYVSKVTPITVILKKEIKEDKVIRNLEK